ncbi:MAG: hypothetical protein IJS81_04100 [Selenomonadaceae bacterium]|nr:hypothetical protein [Selenomonadaceae bacterium]MBQ7629384.1 hypothetical protein [Selenomonadaceae bacterium]
MPKKRKVATEELKTYLVTCEFNEDDEYEDFYEALDEYPAWRNIFGTQWFICSEDSAEDIYRHLFDTMFEDDFIFVCEIVDGYACFLPEDTVDWMENNLD